LPTIQQPNNWGRERISASSPDGLTVQKKAKRKSAPVPNYRRLSQGENAAPTGLWSDTLAIIEMVCLNTLISTFEERTRMGIVLNGRLCAAWLAAAWCLDLTGTTIWAIAQRPIVVEAESGRRSGVEISQRGQGFSGTGYVTGFTDDNDTLELTAQAPEAGIYDLAIRHRCPHGQKGCEVRVNGVGSSGIMPATGNEFALYRIGRVELVAGPNTIVVAKGWGFYDVDRIELTPSRVRDAPQLRTTEPVNPQATAAARELLQRLSSRYGSGTLYGVYSEEDAAYLLEHTGQRPAIMGTDLMDASPSRVERGARCKAVRQALDAHRNGQLVTISWHWNAPTDLLDGQMVEHEGKRIEAKWWSGFYTFATSFDLASALANPKSDRYQLLIRDIDAVAAELAKLREAGVPVLWRPLHEAEGGWFWWGARGAEPFQKLWRLLFERLTIHHRLDNLIWVYSSGTDPAWYPGDDVVDVVGIDAYPADIRDSLDATWETLLEQHGPRKLLALTEFGGTPDMPRMHDFGVWWSFAVSWSGREGPRKNAVAQLKQIIADDGVITLPPR
jgi:mannan endo-1,4-beta-mannosidase